MYWKNTLLFAALLLVTSIKVDAQKLDFKGLDASPMDAAHYPSSAAYRNYLSEDDPNRDLKIKVLYCRPNKKGRAIFGELVPFGQDWRLGANEATEVTFYQPVEIGGVTVPAGSYTMFAEVYPEFWVVKISKERFIAGTNNRDVSQDIAAAVVPTSSVPEVREAFTIGFQKVDEGNVNMVFEWDQTRAVLPIGLNPVSLAGSDASPMDLVAYPASSRMRNYQDPENLEASAPKIRVVYSRPQMKGRKIFGELLKYGEMWRVGANETTEITFFQDVMIGGKEVKAGTYGLFAKVDKDEWEFIVHKNLPSWGNPNHDPSTNVASVKAKTEKTPKTVDALSILLVEKSDKAVDLVVGWENTMARLPITLK
jgi:hypothetical protein